MSADEANPLCDDCLVKYKEALSRAIELKDEDLCDKCRDLQNRHCFCCGISQTSSGEDLDIKDGACKHCRQM